MWPYFYYQFLCPQEIVASERSEEQWREVRAQSRREGHINKSEKLECSPDLFFLFGHFFKNKEEEIAPPLLA